VATTAKSFESTGILFLGDFWHARTGQLPVPPLAQILSLLSSELFANIPVILMPGNHDMLLTKHSASSAMHSSLTPIKFAFAPDQCIVIDTPTIFMNAAFIPFQRDGLQDILNYLQREESVSAIFAHDDFSMISDWKVDTPVYSGHIHKPTRDFQLGDRSPAVTYIGSPYQVTLAEAGERKRMLLVDSKTYNVERSISLDIEGIPKFHKFEGWEDFVAGCPSSVMNSTISKLDNVIVVLPFDDVVRELRERAGFDEDAASDFRLLEFRRTANFLREQGVKVEVRDGPPPSSETTSILSITTGQHTPPSHTIQDTDTDNPTKVLNYFFDSVDEKDQKVISLAREYVENSIDQDSNLSVNGVSVEFEMLKLSGYGSFKHECEFKLAGKGLTLLLGRHEADELGYDDEEDTNDILGSSERGSNGSGKSTLAFAPRWAALGTTSASSSSTFPRHQENMVNGVVNSQSKSCEVSIRGKIDGKEFLIKRSRAYSKRGKPKSSLTFRLGDEDLTGQSMKLTQANINESFGGTENIELLFSNSFLEQIGDGGGLSLGDKDFKDRLINVIDSGGYSRAVFDSVGKKIRSELSDLKLQQDRLEVQRSLRNGDLTSLEAQRDAKVGMEEELGSSAACQEGEEDLCDKSFKIRENVNSLVVLIEGERVKKRMRGKFEEERKVLISQRICPTCKQTIRNSATKEEHRHEGGHEIEIEDNDFEENDFDFDLMQEKLQTERKRLILAEKQHEAQRKQAHVRDEIAEITRRCEELKRTVEELDSKLDESKSRVAMLSYMIEKIFGPRFGVNSFLAKKGVKNLERYIAKYTTLINEDGLGGRPTGDINRSMRLVLDLEDGERVSRAVRIMTNLEEVKYFPLSLLSGGQYRRLQLALFLAVREMSSFRVRSNLMVLDEPFQHLDESGVRGAINCLKSLKDTTILVPMQNSMGVAVSEHFSSLTIVESRDNEGSFVAVRE